MAKLFIQFPIFSEVDIDWEYPNNVGNNNPYDPEDGANYALLIAELTKELASINRTNLKALVSGDWGIDFVVNYLIGIGFPSDRINMSYAVYSRNGRSS